MVSCGAMAVIHVYSVETATGSELRGSGLRTGSASAAVDHALRSNIQYPPPLHATKIFYAGDFVDPAFAELTELAQRHRLEFDIGGI